MTSEEPGESSASRGAAHFKGNLVGDGRREGRGGLRGWILKGGGGRGWRGFPLIHTDTVRQEQEGTCSQTNLSITAWLCEQPFACERNAVGTFAASRSGSYSGCLFMQRRLQCSDTGQVPTARLRCRNAILRHKKNQEVERSEP